MIKVTGHLVIVFLQQGQQHTMKQAETLPTVQRHNSSKETKDNNQVVPVQRRHSGKLPNSDAEVIKSAIDKNKISSSQQSTGGQPVILKPLSNIDNKNIAVKKLPASGETHQGAVTATQPTNSAKMNGTNGSVQPKLQASVNVSNTKTSVSNGDNSVRSSATFSFGGSKPNEQRPVSTKVVVNGAAERSDMKNSILTESKKPTASIQGKSENANNGGGKSLYEARSHMFDELKRFDKKSELSKAAPKPSQPVEVDLGFGSSVPNKTAAPVVKKEVKVQPPGNVTQVKVNSQKEVVKTQEQAKTQQQVAKTQDKVIKTQDNMIKTQNVTKTEIKTQNFTSTIKPEIKPEVKHQFDKLLSDPPSDNAGESETDSEDEALPPSPGEPENYVSQVTFTHKPLNKVNKNEKVTSVNDAADVKQKKTSPAPKAAVTGARAVEPSNKGQCFLLYHRFVYVCFCVNTEIAT